MPKDLMQLLTTTLTLSDAKEEWKVEPMCGIIDIEV